MYLSICIYIYIFLYYIPNIKIGIYWKITRTTNYISDTLRVYPTRRESKKNISELRS